MAVAAYPGSFNPPTIAHLAIAEAVWRDHGVDRVDLIVSRVALGKEPVVHPRFEDRLAVLETVAASRPWLGVRVTDARLLADIADGYDVVVMGTDKLAQVLDPAWYGGSEAARDEAVARLPRIVVVPRPTHPLPTLDRTIAVVEIGAGYGAVSSTAVRAGRDDWLLPEAVDLYRGLTGRLRDD